MAKNLGGAVIGLLEHDRVELRAAAVTVLAAVGRGDDAVEAGLIARLADVDPVVRRLALEALVDHGATGLGPAPGRDPQARRRGPGRAGRAGARRQRRRRRGRRCARSWATARSRRVA
jgi:ClpP class serine protease